MVNSHPSGTVRGNKSLFYTLLLVVVFYHNLRKVTNTPGWEQSFDVVEKNNNNNNNKTLLPLGMVTSSLGKMNAVGQVQAGVEHNTEGSAG